MWWFFAALVGAVVVGWRIIRFEDPFSSWLSRREGSANDLACDIFTGCVAGVSSGNLAWNLASSGTATDSRLALSAGVFVATSLLVSASFRATRREYRWLVPWAEDPARFWFMLMAATFSTVVSQVHDIEVLDPWLAASAFAVGTILFSFVLLLLVHREWPFWTKRKVARARAASGEAPERVLDSTARSTATSTCASCRKPVRPFPRPSGPFVGTVGELATLKIEPDHALVCSSCKAIVCPVCLGKEAGKRGVGQFVCTECGHMPVDAIYRT